jgi:hypothetical protein
LVAADGANTTDIKQELPGLIAVPPAQVVPFTIEKAGLLPLIEGLAATVIAAFPLFVREIC